MSSELARSAAERISIAFDLSDVEDLTAEDVLSAIRKELIDRIIRLLNTNPEKLMSILYRIDVSEARVNEIFSTALPPDVPDLLAELIIERQMAKAKTRAQGTGNG